MPQVGKDSALLGAFAVGITEAGAAFMVVLSLVLFAVGHTEKVESALFLLAFVILLPLGLVEAWRLNRSLSPRDLSTVGVIDAAALAVALVTCRVAQGRPVALLVAGFLILAGSTLLAGPLRSQLGQIRARAPLGDGVIVPLLFVAGLTFMPSWVYTSKGLVASLPVALLVAALAFRVGRPLRTFALVDAVAGLLLAGAILDTFFWSYAYAGDSHSFFLGPANEILHGRTMLVDIFSQYGVGDMYFLAGIFTLVPIGYGTFALVLSALMILEFFVIYTIVRVAGRSQLVAVLASVVAVIFVIFGQQQSFDVFPSTGPLRFGLSFVVILLETLAARNSESKRRLQLASAAIMGLASIWSFEAFLYALGAYVSVVALDVVTSRTSWRRVLRLRLVDLAACVVVVQILFALATRARSGDWPSWSTYLDLIRLYSVRGYGTLLMAPWSPGFVLGGVLFGSALLIGLFAIQKPTVVLERRQLFVALASSTGSGIVTFTYFVGRSHPNNLHHVAPPAILVCALWLCLLMDTVALQPALRFGLVAVAVWVGFMLIDGSHGQLDAKWNNSALGTLLSNGPTTLKNRVQFLASRPLVDPRAQEAVGLLDQYDPGKSRSIVLVAPELTTEILLRADRGNAIPTATPGQDILSPKATRLALGAISDLPRDTVMIADSGYLGEPLDSNPNPTLTELAVWEIRRDFSVRTIVQTGDGLTVASLIPLADQG